ncbi:hypothetical protein Amsp01_047700 [Amycolatopsis sp. NBRC 101858]|uniref:AMIN-like domain-containing (lipo)protein n=1 Tax=Amycolatopsis sp. NBRC 101858 TaxID=3032200 RepID=UPI0024A3E520|nr:hypothetical protein [Amycolatopsis sp. NBRC 101858]GLY38746.1 hypothetical protein Amsp01_047700 [Amycolatopsis sp. NBRC 101858]
MSRPVRRALLAVALLIAGTLAAAAPAEAVAGPAALSNIRTGNNPGFDRVVLDLGAGSVPTVRYQLTDELTFDASGEIVWLTGQYFINVVVSPATYYDASGHFTYPGPQKFRTRNLANVMAVALTGDFEGQIGVGLGVRTRTAVNVFTLTAPNRVVIDIAH